MNTASSLFVLVFFGFLITNADAQVNPRGPRRQDPQSPQAPQAPQIPTGTYHEPAPQYPTPQPPVITYQEPAPSYQPGSYQPSHHIPGHHGQTISERPMQSLRTYETLRLSEALRLSMSQSRDLEVLSVSVHAQGLRAQTTLDLKSRGRSIALPQYLRRQLTEVRFQLPSLTRLDDLELSVSDEAIIDTITVEVRSTRPQSGGYHPQVMQPAAGELLRLQVNQDIRHSGEIHLKQLVKQQLGLSLEGAQIERIAVGGQVFGGRGASVQVIQNNRLVGPAKFINAGARMTPINLQSYESVEQNLKLLVRGDILITDIVIRVGQVRRIR